MKFDLATRIPTKFRKAVYIFLAGAVPAVLAWNPHYGAVVVSVLTSLGFVVAHANAADKLDY